MKKWVLTAIGTLIIGLLGTWVNYQLGPSESAEQTAIPVEIKMVEWCCMPNGYCKAGFKRREGSACSCYIKNIGNVEGEMCPDPRL